MSNILPTRAVTRVDSDAALRDKRAQPLDDAEWRAMLDECGRLVSQERLRLVVYQKGVEPSLRPVVWRHLLNVYPDGLTGEERIAYTRSLAIQYQAQKTCWQRRLRFVYLFLSSISIANVYSGGRSTEELRLVANAVRKDVVRTDRSLPFYSGDENTNANLLALFNLLTTYALCHPDISYCQVQECSLTVTPRTHCRACRTWRHHYYSC